MMATYNCGHSWQSLLQVVAFASDVGSGFNRPAVGKESWVWNWQSKDKLGPTRTNGNLCLSLAVPNLDDFSDLHTHTPGPGHSEKPEEDFQQVREELWAWVVSRASKRWTSGSVTLCMSCHGARCSLPISRARRQLLLHSPFQTSCKFLLCPLSPGAIQGRELCKHSSSL